MNHNLIRKYIIDLHHQQQLRTLTNSKNYLQLGKLSPPHLNSLLLTYLSNNSPDAANTVNTVLENYLNRKALRPADYLADPQLLPLKILWEQFHHKLDRKTMTRMNPVPETGKAKLNKLTTMPTFTMESLNLGMALVKSDSATQPQLLNLRIRLLEGENRKRDHTIRRLQQEIDSLQALL